VCYVSSVSSEAYISRVPTAVMTQCSIVELYKLGAPEQHAVDLAKTFERRKCNHRDAIPGNECITSVVGPSLYSKSLFVTRCTRHTHLMHLSLPRRFQQAPLRHCLPVSRDAKQTSQYSWRTNSAPQSDSHGPGASERCHHTGQTAGKFIFIILESSLNGYLGRRDGSASFGPRAKSTYHRRIRATT
jgi:Fcf1